ncbi:TPA: hypothetical protein NK109_002675 [Vibrio parahaemolyticus]|uniref:hypothetical protein n=1 Tax=Vibrio parahaemolyticus TaxID=670 RepID=UPI00041609A9|nr:hypothetical protein [Vibrio parahaemolyticus]EGR0767722.1 hypothetical protein [Vibrio parahaemolyticus]EGR0837256.1 hypothetical protein [Vibrio parahaemolyticus]MDX1253793.1 hypothetical protein [Vibrio parahaemolyticus]HCE2984596.1 hypothetical protein [Vibrio parahaemolyticus]HCE2989835.1 hypothetical protein [Vibrio parahaemolyticus]
MLKLNRTLMTTLVCLVAMLLTSVSSSVQASTASIEAQSFPMQQTALQEKLGVNTDCVEPHHKEHMMKKGQKSHTSCSSSCIVKIPTTLSQNGLMLLPYSLALIDKPPTEKAVVVIYKPYRPPIV